MAKSYLMSRLLPGCDLQVRLAAGQSWRGPRHPDPLVAAHLSDSPLAFWEDAEVVNPLYGLKD